MSALLETAGVLLLAALGVLLGRWFGSLGKPYWVFGYILPLVVVCLLGMARWVTTLELTPPFSWLVEGRREFALSALLGTILLTTPLSRLPSRRDRRMVCLLYAREGLICKYQHFKTVEELRGAGLTLARVKFGLLVDHYVVVLEVGDREIVVGDPFQGKRTLSKAEFAKSWRFCGVVLKRKDLMGLTPWGRMRATNVSSITLRGHSCPQVGCVPRSGVTALRRSCIMRNAGTPARALQPCMMHGFMACFPRRQRCNLWP